MFHHLVLGSNIVQEMLFDIEKIFFKKKIKNDNLKHHIFISGLSRSGTTALMRRLVRRLMHWPDRISATSFK